jgi:hypothetical protein
MDRRYHPSVMPNGNAEVMEVVLQPADRRAFILVSQVNLAPVTTRK